VNKRFIIIERPDNDVVVLPEAGACRDEVSDDDILLETLKEVDLPEDGSLIEDLGGLLE